jgi:hypothetical protein
MPSDGRVSIYTEREYHICMVLDSYDLVHIFTHAWIATCVCSIINAQIPTSTSVNNWQPSTWQTSWIFYVFEIQTSSNFHFCE